MRSYSAVLTLLLFATASVNAAELTLARAERLALDEAPWLSHHRQHAERARHRVTYEAELPDPQLVVGAQNVPVDSFSFSEEPMTMVTLGVRQAFPPGDTRALRAQQAERTADREHAAYEQERRETLRQVRELWFEREYIESALRLLAQIRELRERDLKAAEGRYRAATASQQNIYQARQDLARVELRAAQLTAELERTKARLTRLIGPAADDPLPTQAVTLSISNQPFSAQHHPLLEMAQADYAAAQVGVDIARQGYKPGMALNVAYGARQDRSDMVTALVTFDLPIRTGNRQDPRVAEMQAHASAVEFDVENRKRELEARYRAARAEHDALAHRIHILRDQLIMNIDREAEVTVAGFARDQTMSRNARLKALDARLDLVRLQANLGKTSAELLYLTGEPTHEKH